MFKVKEESVNGFIHWAVYNYDDPVIYNGIHVKDEHTNELIYRKVCSCKNQNYAKKICGLLNKEKKEKDNG